MIIVSLIAENFRKYKRLEINDIPENGLITVSGANEGGKTSIADALSFALFGRTFFTDHHNAGKLIMWGAKNAMVVLNFIKQGKAYQLTRIVNRDGSTDAQLFCEQDADLVADTPAETEAALHNILGYGYETFSDSFYLVQRELSTPHPNSESIKDMVGIGAYAKISNEMHRANEQDNGVLAKIRPSYEETWQQFKALGIDESWLPDLVEARETLENHQYEKQQLASQLLSSSDEYPADGRLFTRVRRKLGFINVFADLLFAALVSTLSLWGLVKFFPAKAKEWLFIESTENFAAFSGWSELWMPLIGAVLAGLFLLAMLYSWRVEDKQVAPLKDKVRLFSEALQEGKKSIANAVEDNIPPRCGKLIMDAQDDGVVLSTPSDENRKTRVRQLRQLRQDLIDYQADPQETSAVAKSLRMELKEQVRNIDKHQTTLRREIDQEMARTAEAAGMRKQLDEYDTSIRQHTRNIKVQTLAIDLLRSSAKEFAEVFNRSVSKTSGEILPHFTNNHYSNVKIDDDLNVAVFSREKNDFMDFDEISSGTQRQIMLALRIAMSEQLAKNNNNDRQFIILDEPFAFFDHQRTVATLARLPDVSEIITQVWVASQEFPEDTHPDKSIVCEQGNDVLVT